MLVQRLLALLRAEPAIAGTLVASVLPVLVALHVITLDDRTIGLLVVAINTIVGFLVRLTVSPVRPDAAPPGTPQPAVPQQ